MDSTLWQAIALFARDKYSHFWGSMYLVGFFLGGENFFSWRKHSIDDMNSTKKKK